MNYGFDDEGILDEDADFSYVPSKRNPQPVTTKTAAATKPAATAGAAASSAAPKVKSNLNYDDFGFSDDDLDKPSTSKPLQQVASKKPDPILPSTSSVVPRVRGGASAKAAHIDDDDDDILNKGKSDQIYVPSLPEKRVERSKQASALPPINSLQASAFEDEKDSKPRKPSALGSGAHLPSSIPSMNMNNISSSYNNNNNNSNLNDKKKAIKKKQESDFEDDLDDLDDIVAASSSSPPPKNGVSAAATAAVAKVAELEAEKKRKEDEARKKKESEEKDRVAKQKKQQQEQQELERQQRKKREQEEQEKKKNAKSKKVDDDNFEEDLYEEAYEQDDEDFEVDNFKSSNKNNPTSNQTNAKNADNDDEESELSDLPELEFDNDPIHLKKSAPQSAKFLNNPIALENRSTRLESPLPNLSSQNQANRAKERKLTNESKTSKATVNRTQQSKDTRIKPPQYPHQKKVKQDEDELKQLMRDRDYSRMTYKEIKAENDALREKLRAFNQKLTEKIDQSKYQIEKQAIQNSMMSNQPRSRSNQMRTADAETDNNLKIIKRLEDELNKLEQRKALLEDPKYLSNLKLQIETSQNLINKFKAQAKQTSLKNDFQAKELSKISQDSGVTDGVKEGHGIQKDLQLVLERTADLERKLVEFDDLFARKNEAIDTREIEYQKKVKEAKALGVSLNLDLNHEKRVTKYRELAKILDQWEKSNTTLTKMHKTKEGQFLREMDELAKNITGQDDEINGIDSNLVELKLQVQDTIENEKIYPNHRNMKSFFGPPTTSAAIENQSPNPSTQVSGRKGNQIQQSISPSKQVADLKPQMKFKKFTALPEQGYRGAITEEKEKSPTLKTSQSGINFHQKMNPRGNLNDISNQEDANQIQSKPFSLKKGGAVSEARIWKPEEPFDQLANNNSSSIGSNNASSFNFKQKQQAPVSSLSQQDVVSQENIKPNQQPVAPSNENDTEGSSAFEKPQRMFKFKRGEGNNTTNPADVKSDNQQSAYNPSIAAPTAAAAGANNNNSITDAAPAKDEGYSFSTNSRVSRVRGGPSNKDQSAAAAVDPIPEEPSKLFALGQAEIGKGKPAEQDSVATKPTNNTNDSSSIGGYSFSGLGAGTGAGATASRRRGNQPSTSSAFDDDFKLGSNNNSNSIVQPVQQPQQNLPTSLASKQDDGFDINVPSRRNRGAAAAVKTDSYDPLSNGFGFGVMKDAVEEPIKKAEPVAAAGAESKWGWNQNANANTNAASSNALNINKQNDVASKGLGSGSALDTPFNFNSDPAPKTFNFKRNPVIPPSDTTTTAAAASNVGVPAQTNAAVDKPISQQPAQQQQPVVQAVKKDDVMFKGPNDKRISNNRPANANNKDEKKVIKRNIFGDEPEEIVAPAAGNGFLAPKEIGTVSQQPGLATAAPANKGGAKKSGLDDDLDDDDGGLDFLKDNKPKVNYNDDDDIFSKNKKPASNTQQATSKMVIGGGNAKPQDNAKQEREKNLASKAKNEDFFDDLF